LDGYSLVARTILVAAAGNAGTAGADAATASDLILRKEFKVTDYACQSLLILLTFPLIVPFQQLAQKVAWVPRL
jgi:hypothetical protein